jgi:PAS domain S-box-containing protein
MARWRTSVVGSPKRVSAKAGRARQPSLTLARNVSYGWASQRLRRLRIQGGYGGMVLSILARHQSMTTDLNRPLVLVVDDDTDTRELYRIVLESVGYRVEDTGNVKGASSTLSRLVPDAVLTDWMLPDGDGLDVCRALRDRGATRAVPVVAVTGVTFDGDGEARARHEGVVTLLEKPADPDAILGAIREALMVGTERRLRAAAERAKRYAERACRQGRLAASRADAEALLKRAAARSGDSVTLMIVDDSAHFLAASGAAQQLTGYDAGELAALTVWDLTPPPSAAEGYGLWKQFIATGVQQGHYMLRRRDGRPVEAQYVALANIAPGWHVSAVAEAPHMPVSLGTM